MDTTQFLENIKDLIDTETELTVDTKFRELGEWDSLATLSTIAMVDDEYGIVISANELRQLETLGDIIRAIESKL